MSNIVRFPATIILVAAVISMLGSITTYKILETPDAYALQGGIAAAGVTILIDKGNALFNHGNYAQAIQYYDKALDIDANDKVALDNKGVASQYYQPSVKELQILRLALQIMILM